MREWLATAGKHTFSAGELDVRLGADGQRSMPLQQRIESVEGFITGSEVFGVVVAG